MSVLEGRYTDGWGFQFAAFMADASEYFLDVFKESVMEDGLG
jgi:hypothetical protein